MVKDSPSELEDANLNRGASPRPAGPRFSGKAPAPPANPSPSVESRGIKGAAEESAERTAVDAGGTSRGDAAAIEDRAGANEFVEAAASGSRYTAAAAATAVRDRGEGGSRSEGAAVVGSAACGGGDARTPLACGRGCRASRGCVLCGAGPPSSANEDGLWGVALYIEKRGSGNAALSCAGAGFRRNVPEVEDDDDGGAGRPGSEGSGPRRESAAAAVGGGAERRQSTSSPSLSLVPTHACVGWCGGSIRRIAPAARPSCRAVPVPDSSEVEGAGAATGRMLNVLS